MIFQDRRDAGRKLAMELGEFAKQPDLLVLALPRGGIPVGVEIARACGAPLDVFVVRKLGVPGHEELAMGAIASGGVVVRNHEVIDGLHLADDALETAIRRETREIVRRERLYRDGRPPLQMRGRTVLLVDDGLATGSTMMAAIHAVREQEPKSIVVAVPVASRSAYREVGDEADAIICSATPEPFFGVGQFYRDFSQTSDEEVRSLLAVARAESPSPGEGSSPTSDRDTGGR